MKISRLNDLPGAYVSHDSNVEKKVLLKSGDVPHVSQLAVATLKPGEQATEHFHKDMTESKAHDSLGSMASWSRTQRQDSWF
ncbi:hypothetical protein BGW38_006069 [Lunasporangiospora selenospora]|uniref:Cupin domain-containing protein n=1 Tax=Lunasporangiospora selenospora TaxID=979761 RepID=A0A9P6KGB7_9FUNG|nr:hypothetical protein BGW38_006069 [Lunasporangiospora selenospora]